MGNNCKSCKVSMWAEPLWECKNEKHSLSRARMKQRMADLCSGKIGKYSDKNLDEHVRSPAIRRMLGLREY